MNQREEIISSYSAYVNYRDTKPINNVEMEILLFSLVKEYKEQNIIWELNTKRKGKTYFLQDKKVPVVYVSNHSVDEESKNVWIDNAGDEQYIVNFSTKVKNKVIEA